MFERFTKAKSLESAQKIALSLLSEKGEANAHMPINTMMKV